MTTIKQGDKQIVFNQTFLLRDNETAQIHFDVAPGSAVNSTIKFDPVGSDGAVRWAAAADGTLTIECTGWTNTLGTSLTKPAKVGDVGGIPLAFTVSSFKIGESNLVTLQFFVGGTYE